MTARGMTARGMTARGRAAVIGAGIVGVAAAERLRRDGWRTTLIDRAGPAAETSSGAAGLIVANSVSPTQTPDALREALTSQLVGGPVFMDWRGLGALAPWLVGFLAHATPARRRAASAGIRLLVSDAIEEHVALAGDGPAARLLRPEGAWLHLYRSAEPPEGYGVRARRAAGLSVRRIGEAELRERDPALNPVYRSAWALDGAGRVVDPGAYVRALAEAFEEAGGEILRAEAARLAPDGEGVDVAFAGGPDARRFERVVVAAGVWSEALLAPLGLRCRIVAERGYHAEFWDAGVGPPEGWTYMTADSAHVANAMAGRLRVTSVSEPSRLTRPANPRAQAYATAGGRRLYPALADAPAREWMGRRPSTPDSLPLIGPVPGAPRVIVAAGHQHLGLTGGPKTGRLVAELAAGRRSNVDLAPFDPARFSR